MNEENYGKRNPFMDDPAPGFTPNPRYYVWVREMADQGKCIRQLFFTGKQFMENKVNAREYTSFKGALIGLRSANRLLDSLYSNSSFRERYKAEAVMFQYSESDGLYRPVCARTSSLVMTAVQS